ncbi:Histone deacetylase clr3 [Trichuris trichiura]|uniref:Histone deacetylase clr3 n=1 Tax=Trichuris trichiura TaxID=36087 RepID=A0A077Z1W1_TRITR|nr:Histone deacetylase clr3 [Trichuris trichiura]
MYTTGQIVFSMMQRQMLSGVIAGDLPYGYIMNTLKNLVSSTFGKHSVKRPLIVSSRGNEMFFKQTHSDGSTCLWLNTAFIPSHEVGKMILPSPSNEKKEPSDDNTFCVRVELPASRLSGVDRLFVFNQLLLPIAYAHCPDLIVMELDFHDSFYLGIQPSLYSFMVSNLMALASGRLLIIATAKDAACKVEEYLLSVLTPLAGSNGHVQDSVGNGSVSAECIWMTASAVCQLQHLYPFLKSIFLPSREDVNVENTPSSSKPSGKPAADHSSSSAPQVLSKRKSVLSKDKSPQITSSINDGDSNRVVDKTADHTNCFDLGLERLATNFGVERLIANLPLMRIPVVSF